MYHLHHHGHLGLHHTLHHLAHLLLIDGARRCIPAILPRLWSICCKDLGDDVAFPDGP